MSDFQNVDLLIENMDAGFDGPLSTREVACVNKGWQNGEAVAEDKITRLQVDNEALRADAERFRFIASRKRHDSMALVEYEVACISGDNPTEDDYRKAVDSAMKSHTQSLRNAAEQIERGE